MLTRKLWNGVEFYDDPEHPHLTITVDDYPGVSVVTVIGAHMLTREYDTEPVCPRTADEFLALADSLALMEV